VESSSFRRCADVQDTQKITEKVARVNQKVPLFYKSLQSDANAVAVSEELVKTIETGRRI
jgi:HAE1 family hydrophobic/amphiphilic exporter-1